MLGSLPLHLTPMKGGWMAGGAVRRWFTNAEKLSDVDYFFPNEVSFLDFKKFLITNGYKEESSNPNVTTLLKGEITVQCITIKYYETVEALLESFDFNLCQFAWDGKDIYSTPEAIISVGRNHLGVNKLEGNVMDSLRRAFKYCRKGFYPCNGTLMKIAESLRGLSEEDMKNSMEISPNGGKRIIRID